MDAQAYVTAIIPAVLAVIGLVKWILSREKDVYARIERLDEKVDKMNEQATIGLEKVFTALHQFQLESIKAMNELETNMRSSIHGLREDLAKIFGKQAADKDGK